MTLAEFRAAYPALNGVGDKTALYWLGVAKNFVAEDRWQDMTSLGEGLFVAHWLSMSMQAQKAETAGSFGGGAGGLLTSKSVGGVSFSYDVSSVTVAGAGAYNQTAYGRQYWQLAQMFGNGAMQF